MWSAVTYWWAQWRGRPGALPRPVALTFEPTTHCNLRCPQCISGRRAFTRPTGQAQLATFQRIVDQLADSVFYVSLYFQGEPYLNPHFLEMVRYARRLGMFTETSTNGHYLSDETCRRTLESGLDQLVISLDGITPESYRTYRVGGRWETVIEGTRRLMKHRREAGLLRPYVVLQFIVFSHNESEVENVHALARNLGVDELRLKTAQVYEEWNGKEWLPSSGEYSRYETADGRLRLKTRRRKGCTRLWQEPTITWDGQVLPCCFDKDADHPMGNILQQPFDEIWRGRAYGEFRRKVFADRQNVPMCRNCSEGVRLWIKR